MIVTILEMKIIRYRKAELLCIIPSVCRGRARVPTYCRLLNFLLFFQMISCLGLSVHIFYALFAPSISPILGERVSLLALCLNVPSTSPFLSWTVLGCLYFCCLSLSSGCEEAITTFQFISLPQSCLLNSHSVSHTSFIQFQKLN